MLNAVQSGGKSTQPLTYEVSVNREMLFCILKDRCQTSLLSYNNVGTSTCSAKIFSQDTEVIGFEKVLIHTRLFRLGN